MDPLVIVAKLQRIIQDNLQRVGDAMISGGVDNMEKYQYMLGQARTYQYMLQEISNLLKAKEQKDDRVDGFDLPKPEPYIGRYIDADIDGVKVSNPSYKKYYKDLV